MTLTALLKALVAAVQQTLMSMTATVKPWLMAVGVGIAALYAIDLLAFDVPNFRASTDVAIAAALAVWAGR